MTVESATTINQLNNANPSGSDAKSEGDDHLRLLKSTLLTTFPGITGIVTATHTQINKLASTFSVASASSNAVTVDSSGNVGIGTTTPTAKLDLASGSASVGIVARTGTGLTASIQLAGNGNGVGLGSLDISQAGDNTAAFVQKSAADMYFSTSNAECLRLDASGNVVHTANASAPTLTRNGSMVFSLTSNTNLRVSARGTDGVTRTANIALA